MATEALAAGKHVKLAYNSAKGVEITIREANGQAQTSVLKW